MYLESIPLEFAKHVDLDAHEPNKLRHKGPIGSPNCPACTRDYVGRHRKPMPGTLEYAQWVQDTYYEDI